MVGDVILAEGRDEEVGVVVVLSDEGMLVTKSKLHAGLWGETHLLVTELEALDAGLLDGALEILW